MVEEILLKKLNQQNLIINFILTINQQKTMKKELYEK
jgi:hypothetical protein